MVDTSSDPNTPVPKDVKKRIKESYDAIAEHYNENFTRDHDSIRLDFLGRLLEALNSKEKDRASVLELGCGGGVPGTRVLLENQNPVITVTANDLSSTQIEIARTKLASFSNRLTLIQGDMYELSFPEASFDAVIGFYSIIHLPRQEQTELVNKIVRWLKPGGLFLANFADQETAVYTEETWLDQEKGWMFWSAWGGEKSVKIVEEAGLELLVTEVVEDLQDADFLWVLGKKPVL